MNNIEVFNQICKRYLDIDFLKKEELRYKGFFSMEVNANERNLALVLLEFEKQTGIHFQDDFLINGGFSSFGSVCDYMNHCYNNS